MKIVHVISSCGAGGAEMFVKSLLLELKKNKEITEIQLWVMTKIKEVSSDNNKIKFEKKFVDELEKKNIRVKFIKKRPKKDWIKTTKKLINLYKNFKPDVIHSHLESVTFHTCRSLYKYDVPIIQTIHSTLINHTLIQRFFIKRKIKSFVSISKKVNELISNQLKIKVNNIYLIYNGVNVNKFKPNKRIIKKQVDKIISIGRLTKAKDYPNLFNAIKILKNKLIDEDIPEILIVGDGELKKKLKQLALDLNINENLKFLGLRDDIPELLAESDIYVMSSEWEGLSISLIEAVASGIPIVATNAGSNSEIIKNNINGKIIPTKSPEELAKAIYSLIINPDLRKEFSENSKKTIEKFEIETSAIKHFEMYKELLEFS